MSAPGLILAFVKLASKVALLVVVLALASTLLGAVPHDGLHGAEVGSDCSLCFTGAIEIIDPAPVVRPAELVGIRHEHRLGAPVDREVGSLRPPRAPPAAA